MEGPPPENKGDNPDCWAAGLGGTGQPRAQKAKDGKEAATRDSLSDARSKEGTRRGGLAAGLREMCK